GPGCRSCWPGSARRWPPTAAPPGSSGNRLPRRWTGGTTRTLWWSPPRTPSLSPARHLGGQRVGGEEAELVLDSGGSVDSGDEARESLFPNQACADEGGAVGF